MCGPETCRPGLGPGWTNYFAGYAAGRGPNFPGPGVGSGPTMKVTLVLT